MKRFAGCGTVTVLSEDDGMLLLERVVPGISLKSCSPNQEHESIEIACKVMTKQHQVSIPEHHNLPHVQDWLTALDKDLNIPNEYL
jgi:streptomycin 6-kinase